MRLGSVRACNFNATSMRTRAPSRPSGRLYTVNRTAHLRHACASTRLAAVGPAAVAPLATSAFDKVLADSKDQLQEVQETLGDLWRASVGGLTWPEEPGLHMGWDLVSSAWFAVTAPFAIFGNAWLLNILFLSSVLLLCYSLLVVAPKQ